MAFAHLSQIAYVDKAVVFELRDWMEENCTGLVGFLGRMKDQCYADWNDILSSLKMNPPYHEEKKDTEKETGKEKEGEKDKTEEIKTEEEKKEDVKVEEAK